MPSLPGEPSDKYAIPLIDLAFLMRHVRINVPSFIEVIILLSTLACLRPVLSKHWVDSVSKLVQSGDSA